MAGSDVPLRGRLLGSAAVAGRVPSPGARSSLPGRGVKPCEGAAAWCPPSCQAAVAGSVAGAGGFGEETRWR